MLKNHPFHPSSHHHSTSKSTDHFPSTILRHLTSPGEGNQFGWIGVDFPPILVRFGWTHLPTSGSTYMVWAGVQHFSPFFPAFFTIFPSNPQRDSPFTLPAAPHGLLHEVCHVTFGTASRCALRAGSLAGNISYCDQ